MNMKEIMEEAEDLEEIKKLRAHKPEICKACEERLEKIKQMVPEPDSI